jgi:hypothetical protein
MSIALASFSVEGGAIGPLTVQFNPASLKLASSNQIADKAGPAHQASAKTASKLDLELVFDTTDTGEDVLKLTQVLRRMGSVDEPNKDLPKVTFAWASFSFTGSIESVNQTVEYFSPEGVPLRAVVQLSMKALTLDEAKAGGGAATPTNLAPPANGAGATGLAQSLGDPRGGRALANAGGMESMRFPAGPVPVSGAVPLQGPAGLSMPDFGSLGARPGLSFGGGAAAGVARSDGAFAGLGASLRPSASFKLGLSTSAGVAPGPESRFDLSGKLIEAGVAVEGPSLTVTAGG